MNWFSGGALLALILLIVWKMFRKNIAKELAYDINKETEDDITRLVQQAEQIEADTSDPDNWL